MANPQSDATPTSPAPEGQTATGSDSAAGAATARAPEFPAKPDSGNNAGRRRSDRVMLSIAIEVVATDLSGTRFTESSRTEMVSRHGASIVLTKQVSLEQTVTVRRRVLDVNITARILGQLGIRNGGPVYGIAFAEDAPDFWGIFFPPAEAAEDAAARVLLRCVGCSRQRIFALNEIELRVFEANQRLTHPCETCSKVATWARVPDGSSVDGTGVAPGPQDRQHQRMKVKMMACIQEPGRPVDVVQVLDVSRGGVSFRSQQNYEPDSWINIAAPYTPGTANIFVAGRVARRERTEDGHFEYGVQYVKG